MLVAFSTDKLDYISHENTKNNQEIAERYRDEYATFLPQDSNDLALIDIYGIDLYTSKDNPYGSSDRFKIKLQGLSLIAKQHDKIAAITEAGNRGIPSEEDNRQPTINWYNDYLFYWIADKNTHVAFAIIWQNWSNNRDRNALDPADGYFVPIYQNSESGMDFVKYVEREQTIMLREFAQEIKKSL